MSLLARADLPPDFPPLRAMRERLGFVPSFFLSQGLLPRAVEAQAALIGALLLSAGTLEWERKEEIVVAVAAAGGNAYCTSLHTRILQTLGGSDEDIERIVEGRLEGFEASRAALLGFATRLAVAPLSVGPEDYDRLRDLALTEEAILEAVQTAALARLLCTLSIGLGLEADFALPSTVLAAMQARGGSDVSPRPFPVRPAGPYVRSVALTPDAFAPFAFLKSRFGFVPGLFRAQTLTPAALEVEIGLVRDVLFPEDVLPRRQKELIHLVVSAAHLDSYGVAVHTEILRGLGVPPEESDLIVADPGRARLSEADRALLDFARKLGSEPSLYGSDDVGRLRRQGYSDAQILEAIVMTSLSRFLNTLAGALNPRPDFRPRRDLAADRAAALARATAVVEDPDAPLVARSRTGETAAFEELVRRHQARIYRTLVGLTGNAADAEDTCQTTFVKAFRKIGDFAGASRFSTWLTRIAINEGLERLRRAHPEERLDSSFEDADFRPSLVAAWVEDPERLYAREETRRIVHQELARLPLRYRTAVMLRDIEQLSSAEAAAILDLPVATLKTRLLRGRLMMREALAAHFAAGMGGRSA